MQPESLVVPVELREADGDNPARIVGTLLPIGRVAVDRKEIFTPGSISFPAAGVRLLLEHRGREVMRFTPVEDATAAEWRIDAELPDTPEGREAAALVQSGQRKGLSVEFFTLSDKRVSQVRRGPIGVCRSDCALSKGLLRPIESGATIARGESVALTETEATAAATAAIDSYCGRSPGRDSHRGGRPALTLDRQIPR